MDNRVSLVYGSELTFGDKHESLSVLTRNVVLQDLPPTLLPRLCQPGRQVVHPSVPLPQETPLRHGTRLDPGSHPDRRATGSGSQAHTFWRLGRRYGRGAKSSGHITTQVERKSRYLLVAQLDNKTARVTASAVTRAFRCVPKALRHTLTLEARRGAVRM